MAAQASHSALMAARPGQRQQAMALLRESPARHQATQRKWEAVGCVERLTALAPDPAQAVRLPGTAEAARAALGTPMVLVDREDYAKLLVNLRARRPAEDFEPAWAEGRPRHRGLGALRD